MCLTKYEQIRKFEQKVKWLQDLHFVTIIHALKYLVIIY